jgi:hypothetical protein
LLHEYFVGDIVHDVFAEDGGSEVLFVAERDIYEAKTIAHTV